MTRCFLRRWAFALVVACLSAACASLGPKEQATEYVQAVHFAIGQAQDVEISLFEAGTVPGLTRERHVAYHRALSKAFDAEIRTVTALDAWRAGDPVPSTIPEIATAATEALSVVQAIGPAAVQPVVSSVQAVLTAVQQLSRSLGGVQ